MVLRKILPPTYLMIAILLIMVMGYWFPIMRVIPTIWRLTGLIPVMLGIVINVLADRFIKQAQTTVRPFERSSVLAVGGVYRISRNPMYLGFIFILAGIAVLVGAISPWLVVIGFTVLIQCIFIRAEERLLEEEFDVLWNGYCKHTRRWL